MAEPKEEASPDDVESFDIAAYFATLPPNRPLVYDIVKALWGNRGLVSLERLCVAAWKIRNPADPADPTMVTAMAPDFRAAVRGVLNRHTRQSADWSGKIEDDLFYSPQGKGSDTWAVHHDRAVAWLTSHPVG